MDNYIYQVERSFRLLVHIIRHYLNIFDILITAYKTVKYNIFNKSYLYTVCW